MFQRGFGGKSSVASIRVRVVAEAGSGVDDSLRWGHRCCGGGFLARTLQDDLICVSEQDVLKALGWNIHRIHAAEQWLACFSERLGDATMGFYRRGAGRVGGSDLKHGLGGIGGSAPAFGRPGAAQSQERRPSGISPRKGRSGP